MRHAFKPTLNDERDRTRVTRVLWALVLLSLLGWAWAVRSAWVARPAPQLAAEPPAAEALLPPAQELARVLGAAPAETEPAPEQRLKLLGVIAGASGRGVALIAVDGQPPRPFAVGSEIASGLVLQRLATREAMLAESMQGPVTLTLPLPQWQPRSAAAAAAPAEPGASLPPAEATAVQPGPRGDQRGP